MTDLLDGPLLIIIGLAAGGVALCLLLAFAGGSERALARRAGRVAARMRGEAPIAALSLRRDTDGGFDTMIRRMLPRPELLRQRLKRTGYTSLGLGTYALISPAPRSPPWSSR